MPPYCAWRPRLIVFGRMRRITGPRREGTGAGWRSASESRSTVAPPLQSLAADRSSSPPADARLHVARLHVCAPAAPGRAAQAIHASATAPTLTPVHIRLIEPPLSG